MQKLRYSKYIKAIVIIIDMISIAAVFLSFISLFKDKNIYILLFVLIFWILLSGKTKLYSVQRNLTYTLFLEKLVTHIILFSIGIVLITKVVENEKLIQNKFSICLFLSFVLFFVKSGVFFGLKIVRSMGINHRNIMFFTENQSTKILKEIFEKRKDYGYKVFYFPHQYTEIEVLKKFWKDNGIHTIFLPSEGIMPMYLQQNILQEAESAKIQVLFLPNIGHSTFFSYKIDYIESLPILTPVKFPLDYLTNTVIKRSFDIIFSTLVLVSICSWLFPIIAILIKRDSKGSVFFKQKRYGYNEKIFECYKFRTMKESYGECSKVTEENDCRITKIGKFLRKTSIDELPQFINVFLGDMSIVGPRPHMLSVDDEFKPKIRKYTLRSLVKPGITGLAQVNGLRGDKGDRNLIMKKRIIADSFYVRNWTLSLDFIIILKTFFLLIKGDENAR